MKTKRLLMLMFASASIVFAGCNKENADSIGEEKTVLEGDGIHMNSYDALCIQNGQFIITHSSMPYANEIYLGEISCLGKVNGLSSISTVPASGWSDSAPVIEGYGYVVRWRWHTYTNWSHYSRVYVKKIIRDTAGGFIGAIVKYEEVWLA